MEEQLKKKSMKIDKIKREWIQFHKKSTKNDHIIFREDDDLYENAGGLNATQKSEANKSKREKG
jgi:hypothetical protein